MNIAKWLAKISAISLIAVSPLIYLTYLSGEIMSGRVSNHTEITVIDNTAATTELLDSTIHLAYSYTFIIGSVLVAAEILILLKQLYNLYFFIANISTIISKKRSSRMNKLIEQFFGEIEIIGPL